jgi:hypothetical protein
MARQADQDSSVIPAQRCGDRTGHPFAPTDDWQVCAELSGHETQGIDHQSMDGTRW